MRTPIASPMPWRVATASCSCASLRALAKATAAWEAKIHPGRLGALRERLRLRGVQVEHAEALPRSGELETHHAADAEGAGLRGVVRPPLSAGAHVGDPQDLLLLVSHVETGNTMMLAASHPSTMSTAWDTMPSSVLFTESCASKSLAICASDVANFAIARSALSVMLNALLQLAAKAQAARHDDHVREGQAV